MTNSSFKSFPIFDIFFSSFFARSRSTIASGNSFGERNLRIDFLPSLFRLLLLLLLLILSSLSLLLLLLLLFLLLLSLLRLSNRLLLLLLLKLLLLGRSCEFEFVVRVLLRDVFKTVFDDVSVLK